MEMFNFLPWILWSQVRAQPEAYVFKDKEMVFGNGVKNIQAAAHNGARTVVHKNSALYYEDT